MVDSDFESTGDVEIDGVLLGNRGKAVINGTVTSTQLDIEMTKIGNLVVNNGAKIQFSNTFVISVTSCAVLLGDLTLSENLQTIPMGEVKIMEYACLNGSFNSIKLLNASSCIQVLPLYRVSSLSVIFDTTACNGESKVGSVGAISAETLTVILVASVGGLIVIVTSLALGIRFGVAKKVDIILPKISLNKFRQFGKSTQLKVVHFE